MNDPSVNQILQDRYQLRGSLGHGGMGQVFLAADRRLANRLVAVKALSIGRLPPADRVWRLDAFRQEASLLASLSHPGLAGVTDFFLDGDWAYLVMDYVPGRPLNEILEDSPGRRLPQPQALQITDQLCEVLVYLHQQRPPIVFRDLKPGNIMLQPDGQVKLIDFGIARYFQPEQAQDTQQLGTVGYAAPEQYREQTDARSDVYSLGVVLYEMLAGFDPNQLPPGRPPPLDHLPDDVRPHLAAIIDKATQTDPAARFQSALELRQVLEATFRPGQARRQPVPLWAMGLVALLLAAGIGYGLLQVFQGGKATNSESLSSSPLATDQIPATGPTKAQIIETTVVEMTTVVRTEAAATEPESIPSPTVLTPGPTARKVSTSLPFLPGEGVVRVSPGDGQEYVASSSPDGQWLVYSANPDGRWQIYRQPAASGTPQNLTNDSADNYHPHFSPGGEQIVYASDIDGDWDIAAMGIDGSDRRQITNHPGNDQYPSYSPDGQWILFMSDRGQGWGLYAIRPDGRDERLVIDTAAVESFPSFSPDGRLVAFQSNQDGNQEIYLMEWPDGTPRRLTFDAGRDATPVFSPDGRWIVFESNRASDYDIYAIALATSGPDGTGLRNLTEHPADDQVPTFSPDGQWLYFTSDRGQGVDIYRQSIAGLLEGSE
jgi:serine/threonine protein kinase